MEDTLFSPLHMVMIYLLTRPAEKLAKSLRLLLDHLGKERYPAKRRVETWRENTFFGLLLASLLLQVFLRIRMDDAANVPDPIQTAAATPTAQAAVLGIRVIAEAVEMVVAAVVEIE
ncbi:MAG TPA: hypothetical protein VE710_02105 [Candidatus Bathyarchaeia archaeon]|nr:hypothetical protein [Candidatus Bathyarchaeia archaeon]